MSHMTNLAKCNNVQKNVTTTVDNYAQTQHNLGSNGLFRTEMITKTYKYGCCLSWMPE